jgi:uncharacterized repeat protein (TIGR01451 family)
MRAFTVRVIIGSAGCDTANLVVPPDILVLKSVQAFSDPVNGLDNPKAIPGSAMLYTIKVTNSGGAIDTGRVVITDPIPTNTELFVGDIGVTGAEPLLFTDGTPASGFSYSMITSPAQRTIFLSPTTTAFHMTIPRYRMVTTMTL